MRWVISISCVALAAVLVAGCPVSGTERSAFQTLTEEFGAAAGGSTSSSSSGQGGGSAAVADRFRADMTIRFVNNDPDLDVDTKVYAWVQPSSITSFEQQDALIRGGYIQIGRELPLGDAYKLAPGTFILFGPGYAGATNIRVPAGSEDTLTLITPDVLLIADAPPISCESIAFRFTIDGVLATLFSTAEEAEGSGFRDNKFGYADSDGPIKTLAQVDVYECSPLQPGLFFKSGGGARNPNEYFEGESVQIDFFSLPITVGDTRAAAFITIGT